MIKALLLNCLKKEVNKDEKIQFSDKLDDTQLKAVYRLAKRHDLLHFVAKALEGRIHNTEIKKKYEDSIFMAFYRYEQKKYAKEQIGKVFDKGNIEHIFLKGATLCNYYPEPWMRTSCDIDVLVKEENLKQAVEVLKKELGYSVGKLDSHDISLCSQEGVHIELHYTLIEVMDKVDSILQKVWEFAEKDGDTSSRYSMPDELFYFYHIAHMAKHFLHGGCGVRSVLDVWILNHRVKNNREKRYQLLKEGNLLSFAEQIEHLSEVWFNEEACDQMTELLEEYIFDGGVYGSVENKVSIQRSQGDGKFLFVMKRIFMPYKEMSLEYPVLKKKPYLLPIYWCVRWIKCMSLNRIRKAKNEFQANKALNSNKQKSREKLIQILELDVLNG